MCEKLITGVQTIKLSVDHLCFLLNKNVFSDRLSQPPLTADVTPASRYCSPLPLPSASRGHDEVTYGRSANEDLWNRDPDAVSWQPDR